MTTDPNLVRCKSTGGNLPPGESTPRFGIDERTISGGFVSNLKEYFRRGPRIERGAAVSRMSVDWQPRHRIFWRNLRDAISPPKLPPLKVTSKPVEVQEMWSRNKAFGPSQGISLAAHIVVIVLLVAPLIHRVVSGSRPPVEAFGPVVFQPYTARMPAGDTAPTGGGSGGDHDPIPASKGRLPRFSTMQLTPPMVAPKNMNPIMSAVPTVIGPPEVTLQSPPLANYGDPTAELVTDSNGPSGDSGIGSKNGSGIGDGDGPGVGRGENGGFGGGPHQPGWGGIGYPTCMYCPAAKFSDEARKAKFQGTVTLQVVITPDGRGTHIEVVKGLGMGLDEQAIAAVEGWRFRPASGADGKPVETITEIDITFHLL
jgi:TonB family protein